MQCEKHGVTELQQLQAHIEGRLLDGVKHGFFELTRSGGISEGKNRRVKVRSGQLELLRIHHPIEQDLFGGF